MTTIKRYLLI